LIFILSKKKERIMNKMNAFDLILILHFQLFFVIERRKKMKNEKKRKTKKQKKKK